jgi:hypothetical protein
MYREIKNGEYTEYDGNEYRIGCFTSSTVNLISNDPASIYKGFIDITHPNNPNKVFRKIVPLKNIGKVYKVHTIAIYHGLPVGIESYHDDKILLATSDPIFLKEYGFEEVDRMVYMKEVNRDEVELVDKREPAPNFFNIRKYIMGINEYGITKNYGRTMELYFIQSQLELLPNCHLWRSRNV